MKITRRKMDPEVTTRMSWSLVEKSHFGYRSKPNSGLKGMHFRNISYYSEMFLMILSAVILEPIPLYYQKYMQ
jgi:hypothetical protein